MTARPIPSGNGHAGVPAGSSEIRGGLPRWLPWLIVATGVAASLTVSAYLREQERMLAQQAFRLRAGEMISALERRLSANIHVLRGAVGLFAASSAVDRDEFRR